MPCSLGIGKGRIGQGDFGGVCLDVMAVAAAAIAHCRMFQDAGTRAVEEQIVPVAGGGGGGAAVAVGVAASAVVFI